MIWPFNDEMNTQISKWIAIISCTLSILGSVLIFGTYRHYPSIRKPARSLLVWLSLADFGTAVSYILTFAICKEHCDCHHKTLRVLFTLLGIYFPVCSFLWTDMIGLYFYAAIFQKPWIAPRQRIFRMFHIICWFIPALICGTILILYKLPNVEMTFTGSATGGWCWVKQFNYDLLGGKVIEMMSYLFLIIVYVLTWNELRRRNTVHTQSSRNTFHPVPAPNHTVHTMTNPMDNGSGAITSSSSDSMSRNNHNGRVNNVGKGSPSNSKTTSLVKASRTQDMRRQLRSRHKPVGKLLFIPIIFVFLRFWGTAHMIMVKVYGPDADSKYALAQALGYMQALCDPLQGFCNGILFVFLVDEVRQQLFESLRGCLGFRCLECCGMFCCCHYCCSCICGGCNECFDCCLMERGDGMRRGKDIRCEQYGTYSNGHDRNGMDKIDQNDDYYASQYRFLTTKAENGQRRPKGAEILSHQRQSNGA